jgi:hypothetical protein
MSEHFDVDQTLTVTCDKCGKTAGGWDETWNKGWTELSELNEDGDAIETKLHCPECEPLWTAGTGWMPDE